MLIYVTHKQCNLDPGERLCFKMEGEEVGGDRERERGRPNCHVHCETYLVVGTNSKLSLGE